MAHRLHHSHHIIDGQTDWEKMKMQEEYTTVFLLGHAKYVPTIQDTTSLPIDTYTKDLRSREIFLLELLN